MDKIRTWFDQNVDKKQMTTLVVTSVVIGGIVYGARKAGFSSVASIAKGG